MFESNINHAFSLQMIYKIIYLNLLLDTVYIHISATWSAFQTFTNVQRDHIKRHLLLQVKIMNLAISNVNIQDY